MSVPGTGPDVTLPVQNYVTLKSKDLFTDKFRGRKHRHNRHKNTTAGLQVLIIMQDKNNRDRPILRSVLFPADRTCALIQKRDVQCLLFFKGSLRSVCEVAVGEEDQWGGGGGGGGGMGVTREGGEG